MLNIFSFDPAIKYLGFCHIKYNEKWQSEFTRVLNQLTNLYEQLDDISKDAFLDKANNILVQLIGILNNAIKISYINTFDLMPGNKVSDAPLESNIPLESDVFSKNNTSSKASTTSKNSAFSKNNTPSKLKYLLNYLAEKCGNPDVILIEYQMSPNVITPSICAQIQFYYANEDTNVEKLFGENESEINQSGIKLAQSYMCCIEIVHPTLKNTCKIAKDGGYDNFAAKNSKSVANKKHVEHNFNYFLQVMQPDLFAQLNQSNCSINKQLDNLVDKTKSTLVKKSKEKKFDMADAFMQAYVWLKN